MSDDYFLKKFNKKIVNYTEFETAFLREKFIFYCPISDLNLVELKKY